MAGGKRRKYDDIHMTPDVSYISNPDVAHEESDVAVGPIAKFVVALFIFSVVVCALMWLLFNFYERRAVKSERRPSPLARRDAEALPPPPRLQGAPGFVLEEQGNRASVLTPEERDFQLRHPQAEYEAVRKMWEHELNNYAWETENPGHVRIPVEQAMKLYLRNMQATQAQQQPAPAGQAQQHGAQQVPADSSSGRTTHQ
jgi:hypothetical protein